MSAAVAGGVIGLLILVVVSAAVVTVVAWRAYSAAERRLEVPEWHDPAAGRFGA